MSSALLKPFKISRGAAWWCRVLVCHAQDPWVQSSSTEKDERIFCNALCSLKHLFPILEEI